MDSVLGSNPEELQCTYAFNRPGELLRVRSRCPWVRALGLEVILVQLLFVMGFGQRHAPQRELRSLRAGSARSIAV